MVSFVVVVVLLMFVGFISVNMLLCFISVFLLLSIGRFDVSIDCVYFVVCLKVCVLLLDGRLLISICISCVEKLVVNRCFVSVL